MKRTEEKGNRRKRPATVISVTAYEAAVDEIQRLEQEIKSLYREREYLTSYLEWAGQAELYRYFEEHAVEVEDPDQPFPYLECPYPSEIQPNRKLTLD